MDNLEKISKHARVFGMIQGYLNANKRMGEGLSQKQLENITEKMDEWWDIIQDGSKTTENLNF